MAETPAPKALQRSLYRRPGTKHFQLVHRSQRDPLINDSEASDRVLKEIDASQPKRSGGSSSWAPVPVDEEAAGDAAAYGIYFDDADYNYLQHLRPVGAQDSFLIEAPTKKGKGKGRKDEFEILLPEDALPSHPLDEISYTDITSGAAPVGGLQPDMDPKIREVLEALEDEAYAVDDGQGTDGEDDFWKDVVHGGEVDEDDWVEDDEDEDDEAGDVVDGADGFEARVARFKAQAKAHGSDDEDDMDSEGGDTIAALRVSNAKRPPRKGQSAAGSQFSMTSSAMFRNEGLRTLDDRFDQIEKLYEDDDDMSWGERTSDEEEDDSEDEEGNSRPKKERAPMEFRADLDEIMDEFLSRYEVLGGKMRTVLEPTEGGEGGAGKLDRIRRELASLDIGEAEEGEDAEVSARRREKETILAAVDRQEREEGGKKDRIRIDWQKPKERWDCETVLSTYSNVSNHPRILRLHEPGSLPPRIRIDKKTGFPVVEMPAGSEPPKTVEEADEEEGESDYEDRPGTIIRNRAETPAERKARKAGVKEERQARRQTKTATKEAFGNETKRQKKLASKAVAGGGAADVRVGAGVRKLV